MDPLSVSASIIGISTAAIQISRLLKTFIDNATGACRSARAVLQEVTGIYVCLQQLKVFLLGKEEAARSRRSLIMIEQIIVVFTDCVSVFSELEQTLESLKTDEHMRVIDRLKWSMKETIISKLLLRLQASKSSLNFMLTILTCTSMEWAEASMRNLTSLVQEVLRSNVNMSRRLKTLERMHPALAASTRTSGENSANSGSNEGRALSRTTYLGFAFDEELQTSRVYKRAALNEVRFSKSSNSSNGPSSLSGLSLCDVSNVSAIALPISSTELWNHHRYSNSGFGLNPTTSSLDAWYNPPAMKSAFIRTAYFNGQYTNQYAQSKFTGHLIYRRFTITTPNASPVFTEGAVMPQSPRELERVSEEASEHDEKIELEDTEIKKIESPILLQPTPVQKKATAATSQPSPPTSTVLSKTPNAVEAGEPTDPFPLPPETQSLDSPRSNSSPTQPPPSRPLPHCHPPNYSLPLRHPSYRRRQMYSRSKMHSPACSFLCEEEEGVFPTRKWTKPLSNMGDALNWKLEVLHRFNEIQC